MEVVYKEWSSLKLEMNACLIYSLGDVSTTDFVRFIACMYAWLEWSLIYIHASSDSGVL